MNRARRAGRRLKKWHPDHLDEKGWIPQGSCGEDGEALLEAVKGGKGEGGLMSDQSRQVAREIVEFHHGRDCSCEHDAKCFICKITDDIASAIDKAVEQEQEAIASFIAGRKGIPEHHNDLAELIRNRKEVWHE